MNQRVKLLLVLIMPIAIVVVLGLLNGREEQNRKDDLAVLIENNAIKPFSFPVSTKTEGCTVNGPLPDNDCTPGAVFPGVDTDTICVKGYTKTVRNVSVSLKKKIYASYGLSYPQAKGAYEADHLIPLELGGNNDIENIFPESAEPTPGFHEKDLVENYLNHEVCAGRLSLLAAQEQIARDWLAVYKGLTTTQIDELKREFASY